MKKKSFIAASVFFILIFATFFIANVVNAEKHENPCPNGCISACEKFCVCDGPVENAREANWVRVSEKSQEVVLN